jgi:hypothetical protein
MCLSSTNKKNIIAFPLQQCLDVCATMLLHTVLYSGIFSSDVRHRHRGSSCTTQCHLEVLTHCYEKKTRDVVPSRRHSVHLCTVTLFSAVAHWITLQSFLHYANTVFYIDLCLGWGKYALWRHSTFTQLGKRLARISILSQTDSIHIPYNLNRQDQL